MAGNKARGGDKFGGTRIYAPTHQGEKPRGPESVPAKSPKPSRPKHVTPTSQLDLTDDDTLLEYVGAGIRVMERQPGDAPKKSSGKASAKRLNSTSQPQAKDRRHAAPSKASAAGVSEGNGGHAANAQKPNAKSKQAQPKKKAPAGKKSGSYASIHRIEPIKDPEEAPVPQKPKEPMDGKRIIALGILIVALIGLLLAAYFMFLVENIEVEGNERYSAQSIVEMSGLLMGRHMLFVNETKAKEGIEQNPYIQVVSIERELPRTLRITVEERKEMAVISVQGYDVVIDSKGHVLSIGAAQSTTGLIHIIGISQLGFQVNQPLGPGSDMQVKALMALLEQLDTHNLNAEVSGIDLSNPLRLTMQTVEGVTVVLGQADNLSDKMDWLRETLPSLRAGNITNGTLDVSAKGGAIYSPPASAVPPVQQGDERDTGLAGPADGGAGGEPTVTPDSSPGPTPNITPPSTPNATATPNRGGDGYSG